jgi:hypothetical protein
VEAVVALPVLLVEAVEVLLVELLPVVAVEVLLVELLPVVAVDVELLLVVDVDVKPSKSIHKKPAIYIVGFFYLIRL